MDAFYAAVEQLDEPSLRGKPVLVGGTGRRGVVSTASYEARPFGVGSAMPMAEARRRCPQAIVLPPRFERYQEVSERIMGVFDAHSPLVEPLSLDEAFLDMTGSEGLFGPPRSMAESIKRAVTEATAGLTVSVGVATTKFVAKVASDYQKPDGLTLVPEGAWRRFLWPLSVTRLWGVGPKSVERVRALGLETIGDVAEASPRRLAPLGSLGDHILALSRAEDPREVVPERQAKSIGAEMTLEKDVRGAEQIRPHLRRAATEVGRRLRDAGLDARGLRIKLKTAEFRLLTRQCRLGKRTSSTQTLLEAAEALLGELDVDRPFRLVGLAAFGLEERAAPVQTELFPDAKEGRREELDRALDSLEARFGKDVVRRGDD